MANLVLFHLLFALSAVTLLKNAKTD